MDLSLQGFDPIPEGTVTGKDHWMGEGVPIIGHTPVFGPPEEECMAAKDRKFTQLAADICGFRARIDAGVCPTCGGEVDQRLFTSDVERSEFEITGICKTCQDQIFKREE